MSSFVCFDTLKRNEMCGRNIYVRVLLRGFQKETSPERVSQCHAFSVFKQAARMCEACQVIECVATTAAPDRRFLRPLYINAQDDIYYFRHMWSSEYKTEPLPPAKSRARRTLIVQGHQEKRFLKSMPLGVILCDLAFDTQQSSAQNTESLLASI